MTAAVRGLPYIMSAKFFDPPHTEIILILFLLSAFWGPPSPHPLRTSYMEAPSACGPCRGLESAGYITLGLGVSLYKGIFIF